MLSRDGEGGVGVSALELGVSIGEGGGGGGDEEWGREGHLHGAPSALVKELYRVATLFTQRRAPLSSVRTVASKVLASGENCGVSSANGRSALHLAADVKSTDLALLLVSLGSELDTVDPTTGETPLILACDASSVDVALLLIASGATVSMYDHRRRTALHVACRRGLLEVSQALIVRGADIGATDDSGRTCLHVGALFGEAEIVAELLKHAPGLLNVRDGMGRTPLHCAAVARSIRVADVLLAAGSSPYALDRYGISAIESAERHGSRDLARHMKGAPRFHVLFLLHLITSLRASPTTPQAMYALSHPLRAAYAIGATPKRPGATIFGAKLASPPDPAVLKSWAERDHRLRTEKEKAYSKDTATTHPTTTTVVPRSTDSSGEGVGDGGSGSGERDEAEDSVAALLVRLSQLPYGPQGDVLKFL